MLNAIRQFFQEHLSDEGASEADLEHRLQLATAALLIETSRADSVRRHSEQRAIETGIAAKFDLTPAETAELIALAEEEARQSVSDHQFVRLINLHFSMEQRVRIVALLWEVAYADNHLDKHEEHFVRRIAELLYVPHADFIATKLKVQQAVAARAIDGAD